jgi:hypothetical protein
MATISESQRMIAYAVTHALESAEATLPAGAQSRLWAACRTSRATLRYLQRPTGVARADLAAHLDQLRDIESMAVLVGQLPPESIVSRGISLAIHIAQAALAAVPTGAHALCEAKELRRLTA